MPTDRPFPRAVSPDEADLPPQPPAGVRDRYLKLSWAYVCWCAGMLAWTLLCIVYFVLTWQKLNTIIGICLGLLLIAMISLPALLFGGKTWYKRLGWMTILLGLFSVISIYPVLVVILGIRSRFADGTFRHRLTAAETLHVSLCVLTLVVTAWTGWVTGRAVRLVQQLYRGDYGVSVKSRK